jgi:hypothetical protein
LAIYTVHSRDLDAIADARFLRDGFSWSAFSLGPFWLLRHGLYASCVAWIGALVVVIIAARTILSPDTASGAFLALQALLGLEADHLLQIKLDRQGYRLVDIVAAPNLDEAEVAFFRRQGTANVAAAPDSEARP